MRKSVKETVHRRVQQILLLLFVLCFGAGIPKTDVKAAQTSVSHGNLIYEEGYRNACFYAEDILLLEEKLSSIPEQCFDPLCYAHTHNWEYCRINERTHTRHCAECGEANDLTSAHRADRWESDTISHEGKTYPAKRFTCACGYQWRMELNHTIAYETVNELSHRGRCVLDGTVYCRGYEPIVEEHYAWYYEMGEDGIHHEKICFDCGLEMEEVCSFDEMVEDEELRVCICGRSAEREEESEAPDQPETEEPPEEPDEPESEDPPGASDESESEDPPETSDESESEDSSETSDESENEDLPETSDESEKEDPPETSDRPGTGDAPKVDRIRVDSYKTSLKQKEDFDYHEKSEK